MSAVHTAPKQAHSPLIDHLRAGGIVAPRIAVREAKRAGLPLELACALLEKESTGGRNVYGHDPSIFSGAGKVTRENYARYKRQRLASRNRSMQGVGPCQLTWWEFQDAADAAGGCWRPATNMRTGFSHLAALVKRYGESDGARRYNGTGADAEAYSRDLLVRARKWEGIIDGHAPPAARRPRRAVRRGDSGAHVRKLTRKLAHVKSPVSHEPYLKAPASRVDAEVERAVKEFQREHKLEVDGVAGPKTMKAVTRAAERTQRPGSRAANQNGSPPEPRHEDRAAHPAHAPAGVPALAAEVRRRDDAADRAWRRLVASGHKRRRALHEAKVEIEARKGDADAADMKRLLEALARIEGRLDTLVEVTEHKAEIPVTQPETPPATPAPVKADAPPPPATGATAPAERPPEKYSVPELVHEVEALDARRRRLRDELIERYTRADEQLAHLRGETRPAADGPPPRERRHRPPPRHRPRDGDASRSERDPLGGKTATTTLGDRGLVVRRSKIALARYLAAHGSAEHRALRRRLRREAATPKKANLASPAWGRAVKAAQHVAGRPVTGELDGELTQILLPYWPRDQLAKRVARSTPAWRAIPGQLTPNFNIKELACKDGAHTSYVSGLMREEGLSKKEARHRAKGLATRLERVRTLGGGRPLVITSAFRTRAYNASLSGSATNSAHTRGFAVDTPPPRGVSLDQHKQHVLKAFECGVGYYPPGRGYFIHGDFDHSLGGRRTW
jgi:peptidoglycan hydrolase-like protein with peptidoglycan-binding domain